MERIPPEMIYELCMFLDTRSLLNFTQTCREYNVWKELVCYLGNKKFDIIDGKINWKHLPNKYIATNVDVIVDPDEFKDTKIYQGRIIISRDAGNVVNTFMKKVKEYVDKGPPKLLDIHIPKSKTQNHRVLIKGRDCLVIPVQDCDSWIFSLNYFSIIHPVIVFVNYRLVLISLRKYIRFLAKYLNEPLEKGDVDALEHMNYRSVSTDISLKDLRLIDLKMSKKINDIGIRPPVGNFSIDPRKIVRDNMFKKPFVEMQIERYLYRDLASETTF